MYKLVDISTLELRVKHILGLPDGSPIKIDFGGGFTTDLEKRSVFHIQEFTFSAEGQELAYIKVGYAFLFEDLGSLLKTKEDNTKVLDVEIRRQLFAVGLGTTRGVFHTRTEGMANTKLYIPVLNPQTQILE